MCRITKLGVPQSSKSGLQAIGQKVLLDWIDIHIEVLSIKAPPAPICAPLPQIIKLVLTLFDLGDVLGFGLAYPVEAISYWRRSMD